MTTNHSKQEQDAIQQQIRPDVNNDFSFKWLIILLALLGACILALYFMNFSGSWGNQADFGAFGDYVGGVLNPVLGFATVGLLVWSLKMQRDELSLSRQELALTRQELAETKEETSLSRLAMEAQVAHLKQEAKLNELRGVLSVQLGIINDHLAAPVFSRGEKVITYRAILNNEDYAKSHLTQLGTLFHRQASNPVQNVGRALEIQLIQLAYLCLEYSKESNSQLYALPYLVNAVSLLGRYHHFQPNENIKGLLESLHARIAEGKTAL
ncbi:hypothetical protein [Shewanella psychrotolerans]|uniref:hypothetical protein n=1 Tax=Shewanella psychrotolerans TaxID=2864206 RepID=UPI001C65DC58|nr:hypothetical protein [Shewanella psychrotolerans]QYK02791.1 hypothetical protein K0I62_07590 [Shewanella psychrotolerans]